jgi:uncharacterized membrane protein
MKMRWYLTTRVRLGVALGCTSLLSFCFFVVGALSSHDATLWYLNWNLFLAWVPLLIMLWLERTLRHRLWSSWQALLLTFLFVVFLPNTFYVMTDIIHLQEVAHTDLIYDVVMFNSFIFNACILGFLSIYLLHAELRKRISKQMSWLLVLATIFSTSFAIYIGRDLRWSTWDVLLNPASILFEVSERLLHPSMHPELLTTTCSFFVLLSSLYVVVWFAARATRQQKFLD